LPDNYPTVFFLLTIVLIIFIPSQNKKNIIDTVGVNQWIVNITATHLVLASTTQCIVTVWCAELSVTFITVAWVVYWLNLGFAGGSVNTVDGSTSKVSVLEPKSTFCLGAEARRSFKVILKSFSSHIPYAL